MTHLGHIAPYMHFTLEAPNQHRILHKLGVEHRHRTTSPTKLEAGRVLASHVYDEDGHEHEFAADAVVLVTQRLSDEALYRELKDSVGIDALEAEGITGFYRIGDCVAPRLIADAIFDGPPARARDRLGQPGRPAALHARAPGDRARGGAGLSGLTA